MKLIEWLTLTGMTQKEFCALAGITRPTINRHIKLGRVLEPDIVTRIYFLTMGAVRPDDFYDLTTMPPDVAAFMTGPKAKELWRFYNKIPGAQEAQ